MRAVCMLCGLLLVALSCAAAAAVTHGDLMLSGGTPFNPYQIQVRNFCFKGLRLSSGTGATSNAHM